MTPLSQPRYKVTVDKGVQVPVRDGTLLAADVYRPAVRGRVPAIVERTPYNREESVILRTGTPQFFAERGYAFVVQDVRGRYGSEGSWHPFVNDPEDGYDTVQWVAAQSWCDGKVGTAGGSYAGQTQMLVAPTRPRNLRCCFVREAASDLARQWAYRGGAFEWGFNYDWCMRHAVPQMRKQIDRVQRTTGADPGRFDFLPLDHDPRLEDPHRWLRALLAHPDDGEFWAPFNFENRYDAIDTPIYHMAGWFDIFLDGSLRNFQGTARAGKTKAARQAQKLIVGPWSHGPTVHDPGFARHVGDMDFGPDAVLDFNGEMLRWYDHWLKGIDSGTLDEPRVRYFLMGANEWRTADAWPPAGLQAVTYYLGSGKSGTASSLNDGRLLDARPPSGQKPDRYRYDPADPVPTVGGNTLYSGMKKGGNGEENPDFSVTAGPRDQRAVEPRCLTYTTEPLQRDLDVVGPVTLTLFASSSCVDTDFAAKLCDVFPDGRSMLVTDGILRARYRASRQRPSLLEPKKVYEFTVELWPTAWRFAAGHRLRLAVTSSNFPRFDRNLNTGLNPATSAACKVATNTVHHDAEHPSRLTLPCLPHPG